MALGKAYFYARQFDDSIVQSQKTLEMDPGFMPALFFLARAYHQKGKREEAIEIARKLVETSGGFVSFTAFLGYMCTGAKPDESRRILETLLPLTNSDQMYVSAFLIALIYAGLEETDLALDWLEKACEERALLVVYLNVDPAFDSLQSHPRFRAIRQQLGL